MKKLAGFTFYLCIQNDVFLSVINLRETCLLKQKANDHLRRTYGRNIKNKTELLMIIERRKSQVIYKSTFLPLVKRSIKKKLLFREKLIRYILPLILHTKLCL